MKQQLRVLVLVTLFMVIFSFVVTPEVLATGAISGTVSNATGSPVQNITVVATLITDSSVSTPAQTLLDGTYIIQDLEPGTYSIFADTGDTGYAGEYYDSTYDYLQRSNVDVVDTVTTSGVDFSLDVGGTISGVVFDDAQTQLGAVPVTAIHYLSAHTRQIYTAPNGSFSLSGIPPGQLSIEILPNLDDGLVSHSRLYWFESAQNKDLGVIVLEQGALVSGVIQDDTASPIDGLEYWIGENQFAFQKRVESDGSFQFRVPVGRYSLNAVPGLGYPVTASSLYYGSGYSMMPEYIDVTDINQEITLPAITGYDIFTGQYIWGTIIKSVPHNGIISAVAYVNDPNPQPDDLLSLSPMWLGAPEIGTGTYAVVVPQGATVNIGIALITEESSGLRSLTAIDLHENYSSPYGPSLIYDDEGQTIDGLVTDQGLGLFTQVVLLYGQPGNIFTGVSQTDSTGSFSFYNVPAGSYRVVCGPLDHVRPGWSNVFTVSDTDVNVPDIDMGKSQVDFDIDQDVDGKDLAEFIIQTQMGVDLASFAQYFGV